MRLRIMLAAATLGWGIGAGAEAARAGDLGPLRDRVESIIRESGAEAVAVAFRDPATGEELLIRPDESFHAASTMKLAVLAEVHRQAGAGTIRLDDRLPIGTEFRSLADGSPYTLRAEDDSETTLYARIGQTETVRELARLMIVRSSNLATNLLIARLGADAVARCAADLGGPGLVVRRGVEDGAAFRLGMNNTTTAAALMRLLGRVVAREAISPEASDAMIAVLKGQELRDGIPAGLPPGTPAAHKTGSITAVSHDAGIVFPPGRAPYVLVVLTRGLRDPARSHALIADISAAVFVHAASTAPAPAADAEPAPRAFVDGTGPGWRTLGAADFVTVNGDPDTWAWSGSKVAGTGVPVGVARTARPLTNFELVARWRHLKAGGNSGFFAWVPESALAGLKPGALPSGGIEVQILDHGYRELYEKESGKKADWFTTDGDVFPVGTSKMTPFPPTSPNGQRSFPARKLTRGVGQWNHYYVRCINGEVRLWVNGEEVSGGTRCEPRSGYLCLEAEGSPVEFQDIRVRELP